MKRKRSFEDKVVKLVVPDIVQDGTGIPIPLTVKQQKGELEPSVNNR
jgi:hypothetical protein